MKEKLKELFTVLPDYLGGHLLLAVPAILAGVLVSVPLGVLCARNARVRGPLMTVASLFQTVPSIALLAIMVALLGGTIGYRPAFIALLIYSMLPILRNTLTGLEEVDPAMREAARGVGMTPHQSLWRVELPLALPVILAGIRTATVWVVGITTLSTPVGAPSLGNYIFSGLQLRDWTQVYFGCLFAMGLTLVLDQVVHVFELAARRQRPALAWGAGGMLALVLGAGLIPLAFDGRGGAAIVARGKGDANDPVSRASLSKDAENPLRGKTYAIGAKGFTEQAILGRWISGVLRASGAEVTIRGNMGSTILFDALRRNHLDLYVDYSGTIWATVMEQEEVIGRSGMFIEVAHYLREQHGITALGRLGFENAYCLAMRRDRAAKAGIRSIADLRARGGGLVLGGDPEFFGRPEWTRVRDLYGLERLRTRGMESTFMYQAVRDEQVDLIAGFSTDGRISAFDLVVLDDPKQAFPPYDAMILLSPEASRDLPLSRVLRRLLHRVDVELMRRTNQLVDIDGRTPREAAENLPLTADR